MQMANDHWTRWAEQLNRLGLRQLAAWFLDAGSPLRLIGAQALYFSQPFFNRDHTAALAHLLEDDGEAQAFAAFLREEMDR